ncbi:hypothetical protein SAMN04487995_6017 [Dyadobacter koreensis]|uniref:Uncharacterized protein n=1 Tax=Dyadobacter koreensis TaxID=408657 RepID=A0A1H7AYA9_9BACT|nr:hypothetical protein [Dyadobacter koreensis]SEJ69896.1 hypothetical protein SAMN04487995_6017 [Dyadobacter koreensis]
MTISVFYDRAQWPALVSQVILPFYHHRKENQFAIFLSAQRGDHITLVPFDMELSGKYTMQLLVEIDHYIISRPSQKRVSHVKDLFQDFQNNSIHFDIDNFEMFKENGIVIVTSWIILQELSLQVLDDEVAYSILVLLLTALICTYFGGMDAATDTVQAILQHQRTIRRSTSSSENFDNRKHAITSLTYANSRFVSTLFDEIWKTNTIKENSWIDLWLSECKILSNKISFNEAYRLVFMTFCRQTDLVEDFSNELVAEILSAALDDYKGGQP